MTDRERLTALIMAGAGDCFGKGGALNCSKLADYLLANGVIVPPCKVGDTVYELDEDGRIVKGIVQSIRQNLIRNKQGRWIVTSWLDDYYVDLNGTRFPHEAHLYSPFSSFGETVFLTREEAEKALKERER